MGPAFSLIRYETNELPVWFKAVGKPNLREFCIHGELAKLRSPHLPETLAVHPDWHGWLMSDANGTHLDRTSDIEHWKTAARSLAESQIESVPACESLLAAGCDDLRMTELRRRIEPFVHMNEQLMAMQPATPPPILSQDNLRFIEVHLQRAIDEMEMLGIPDTIGHSDLNPGNVLVNHECAVFLDWMQGHIGHPVVTFEYLLALLGRLRPDCESWRQAIMTAYFDVWKNTCSDSEARMVRALQLAPFVAPFAFAMSCCPDWNTERISTEIQKLMRALARRMFAAARGLA